VETPRSKATRIAVGRKYISPPLHLSSFNVTSRGLRLATPQWGGDTNSLLLFLLRVSKIHTCTRLCIRLARDNVVSKCAVAEIKLAVPHDTNIRSALPRNMRKYLVMDGCSAPSQMQPKRRYGRWGEFHPLYSTA
jgi:hypothetical protein